MRVYLISQPAVNWLEFEQFEHDEKVFHLVDRAAPAETLCELAGRICYMSYGKGRKTTTEFLDNIIKSGHHSVLEHANFTLFVTGISRSCSHEIVRHRHLSYSQLSQRYVDESEAKFIMPEVILSVGSTDVFLRAVSAARTAYRVLVSNLEQIFTDAAAVKDATLSRKSARQAARSVLPNATETKIAVTGNARAWRHFITLRASVHADPEIRALAVEVYHILVEAAPLLFKDMEGQVCGST